VGALSFEVQSRSSDCAARRGGLRTPHGTLDTPCFFPVGTYGAVRGIEPDELRGVGVQGVLANAYHLHLRPGEELVEKLGGLHGFMGWRGPILTDSGGFQLHSLAHLAKRDEEGVRFRSPIDGSERLLSPETAVRIQEQLGGDLICVLDEFDEISAQPDDAERARARAGMERTLRWAERARSAHTRADQSLFGIVQGGGSAELRAESAERTRDLGFVAFAIGGLGVGDSATQRAALLEAALAPLPGEAPRYLMGLGEPEDLVAAIERGVDLFDCVVPTRNGRHGVVFTAAGRLNLRNARFRSDERPLEDDCPCPACARHSRAYLAHLLRAGETLGSRLLSLHNIAYYMRLLAEVREVVSADGFVAWRDEWRRRYGPSSAGSSDAAHSAA
jgi:queuine tRNA-ribosyltransferase